MTISKTVEGFLKELPLDLKRLNLSLDGGITRAGGPAAEGEQWGPTLYCDLERTDGRRLKKNFHSRRRGDKRQYLELLEAAVFIGGYYQLMGAEVDLTDILSLTILRK